MHVVGRSHVTYRVGISLWTDRETGLKALPYKKAFQYRIPTAHSSKCCKCYESHQMSAPSGSPQVNNFECVTKHGHQMSLAGGSQVNIFEQVSSLPDFTSRGRGPCSVGIGKRAGARGWGPCLRGTGVMAGGQTDCYTHQIY